MHNRKVCTVLRSWSTVLGGTWAPAPTAAGAAGPAGGAGASGATAASTDGEVIAESIGQCWQEQLPLVLQLLLLVAALHLTSPAMAPAGGASILCTRHEPSKAGLPAPYPNLDLLPPIASAEAHVALLHAATACLQVAHLHWAVPLPLAQPAALSAAPRGGSSIAPLRPGYAWAGRVPG